MIKLINSLPPGQFGLSKLNFNKGKFCLTHDWTKYFFFLKEKPRNFALSNWIKFDHVDEH